KPTGFVGQFGVDLRPNSDGLSLASGSSGIDAGVSLAGAYNGSINSLSRPQGNSWDIGAYEFKITGSLSLEPPLNVKIVASGN
ncbi:MAG: choice-of-anchor Q domain-containing protein, partial [Gammaproteobacteria bacterium]